MVGELAALCVVVSSTAKSVLWCSPCDTFRVEVVGELAIEFQKMEEQQSWLERPITRIYELFLGPPSDRA
jgi:hypothetical protein